MPCAACGMKRGICGFLEIIDAWEHVKTLIRHRERMKRDERKRTDGIQRFRTGREASFGDGLDFPPFSGEKQEGAHEAVRLHGRPSGTRGSHGFYGNLWHCYLSNLLVNHENSYSRACEIRGAVEGTVNAAVLHDIAIFRELFTFDFAAVSRALQVPEFGQVLSYEGNEQESRVYNTRIRDRICTLAVRLAAASSAEEMKERLTEFYREYGVGKFGLHKAFRIGHRRTEDGAEAVVIEPILNIAHVKLSDLVGYETAKKKLVENTEAFVSGRKANNCLLYGDAGTGNPPVSRQSPTNTTTGACVSLRYTGISFGI